MMFQARIVLYVNSASQLHGRMRQRYASQHTILQKRAVKVKCRCNILSSSLRLVQLHNVDMAAHSSLMERFIAFESEKPTFPWTAYILLIFIVLSSFHFILDRLFYGRLSHVPGPKLAALSWYYISYLDLRHCRHKKISEWHSLYGPGKYLQNSKRSISM